MYKVLLADDEPEILEGLSVFVPWERYGFRIAQSAESGVQALEFMEHARFDLLITDIRMPGLSGLDLIRSVREVNPSLKIIILSGYGDFSYAKQAIDLGVDGYLLKPVDDGELSALLTKLRERMDDEKRMKKAEGRYRSISADSFMMKLTEGLLDEDSCRREAEELGIGLDHQAFRMALFEIEDCASFTREDIGELALLNYALRNIAEELLSGRAVVYSEAQGLLGALICQSELTPPESDGAFEEICAQVEKNFGFSVFVGIGSTVGGLLELKRSKDQARRALMLKWTVSPARLVYYERFAEIANTAFDFNQNLLSLLLALDELDPAGIDAELRRLLEASGSIPDVMLFPFSQGFLFGVRSVVRRYKGRDGEALSSLPCAPALFESPRHFALWIKDVCRAAMEMLTHKDGEDETVASRIVRHIDENFTENLTIRSLASDFYLNDAYLGQLIKRHLGESFSDYLNKKRISEVIRLVFVNGRRVSEAIAMSGYTNPEHFYRQFKRFKSISFGQYRKNIDIMAAPSGGSFSNDSGPRE